MPPTQESCLIGRRRVGLLRGAGELMDAEKNGRRGFSSTPTGLWVSESEGPEEQKVNEGILKCLFIFGDKGRLVVPPVQNTLAAFFTANELNFNEGRKP